MVKEFEDFGKGDGTKDSKKEEDKKTAKAKVVERTNK